MRLTCLLSALFLGLATVQYGEAFKILVYSNLFGHSHVKFLGAVADILTDAGHDVTLFMPLMDAMERNRTGVKKTKKVIFVETSEYLKHEMADKDEHFKDLWTMDNANPLNIISMVSKMANMFVSQCDKVMGDAALLEQLKNEKFDLGIAEPFDMCPYALFEEIKMPAFVSVLSCVSMDHVSKAIGQPLTPSYVPSTQSTFGEKMTMKQRAMNTMQMLGGAYMFNYVCDQELESLRKTRQMRDWRDIVADSSFLLTNSIPFLDFPAPTISKIIAAGGLSVSTNKKDVVLPEKWDKILSERKTNVLVSFGSNIKSMTMPDHFKKAMLDVFESMPQTTFIWKYEEDGATLADHLPNVHLGKWLPQNELLADKRLSLFVTHGGLGSITELAMLGKPCVVIPLFADQGRNAQMLSRHGGGVVLHKSDLSSPDALRDAIKKILNDNSYRVNAEKLSSMLNNQPTSPQETLIKHVEFAARYGKLPSMDPYGRKMSFIEYFMVDVIAVIATCLFLGVAITSLIVWLIVRRLCCSSSRKPSSDGKKND